MIENSITLLIVLLGANLYAALALFAYSRKIRRSARSRRICWHITRIANRRDQSVSMRKSKRAFVIRNPQGQKPWLN